MVNISKWPKAFIWPKFQNGPKLLSEFENGQKGQDV